MTTRADGPDAVRTTTGTPGRGVRLARRALLVLVLLVPPALIAAVVLAVWTLAPPVRADLLPGSVRVRNEGVALSNARVEVTIGRGVHRLDVPSIPPGTTDLPWARFNPPILAAPTHSGVGIHARRLGVLGFNWFSAAPAPPAAVAPAPAPPAAGSLGDAAPLAPE